MEVWKFLVYLGYVTPKWKWNQEYISAAQFADSKLA